jgi:hypothetical protein
MKTLNIPLDDKQYKVLKNCKVNFETVKGYRISWEKFLVVIAKSYNENGK